MPSSSSQIPCNVVRRVLHGAGGGGTWEQRGSSPSQQQTRPPGLLADEGGSEWRCHCLESLLPVSCAALSGGAGLGRSRLAPGFLLVLTEHSLPLLAPWPTGLFLSLIRACSDPLGNDLSCGVLTSCSPS